MNNKTILVVDDEMKIRVLLKDFLEREGYRVIEAADGKQALDLYNETLQEIDLILLDIMLPIIDGWTVCREIKKISEVPVIMLTARSEDFDEVHGFEIGADDYVQKPVKPSALIARIKALFKRIDKQLSSKDFYSYNGLEIDAASHQVRVSGELIPLSPKEFELLLMLVQNNSQVISREQLMNQIWGYDYYGGLRTVDTHINRLRSKLGTQENYITTIRGYGYKFEVTP